jgi:hypothetical protein
MRSVLAAVSLSLCLAPPALAADDIAGSAYTSGFWSGAAEQDGTGAFVDCYATVSYVNGERFWISLYPDDSLIIFLSSPAATYQPGTRYQATLMTEVGLPVPGEAIAADASFISFALYGMDSGIDYLTQGVYLRLLGVGMDQSFDIRGLGGAVAMARSCLDQHRPKTTAAPNPIGRGPSTSARLPVGVSPQSLDPPGRRPRARSF